MKPRNFNLKYSFKYISKQQQKLNNDMNLPSRVKHKKKKSKSPLLFSQYFLATVRTQSRDSRYCV
jgi:hypothetical protein